MSRARRVLRRHGPGGYWGMRRSGVQDERHWEMLLLSQHSLHPWRSYVAHLKGIKAREAVAEERLNRGVLDAGRTAAFREHASFEERIFANGGGFSLQKHAPRSSLCALEVFRVLTD